MDRNAIELSRIPINYGAEVEVRVDKKYSKCMKMSTPTSLWCYCSNTLKWNAGKVYCDIFVKTSLKTD